MSDRSWLVLNVKWCCLRVEWVCAKSPLPSFPLWLFPCPCSILLPCPRRGRVHFTPFFLFLPILRLLSSHIRHNSLFSLNLFLYFHFTLRMMLELKNLLSFEYFCIFIHNISSISLLICRLSKLLWPSKGRLAAWLDNDDNIVKIWSWYWRQACLVMMIGKWQLTGAWCRTAYCPWPAVQPGASTSKYDNIHLKKYSTTLWDIFALNFVPLFLL